MKESVREVRKALDALAGAELLDNDSKEIVYDRERSKIQKLDREGIIESVKKAVGNNPKRRRYAPLVFSELHDVPGIEGVFRELLRSSDSMGRADIIQTIGLRKMQNLVGVLNDHFSREADDFCRSCLLHSIGSIADESSLPIFLY